MAVTIRKAAPTRKKKAVAAKKAKKELQGLEDALSNYHDRSDHDLALFIEPHPDRADNLTRRLDSEQQEARLVLMHRMLIRKVGPEEIRTHLKISSAMYYKLKDQLDQRMRLDTSKVDVPYLIGDSLAFYDEVRSMALTMSSSTAITDPRIKVSAMQVALRAEQDKNAFLASCGVYSSPVIEHIVRGMVSTGNFSVIEGQSTRVIDAEEVNLEIADRLRAFAAERAVNCTASAGE